MPQPRGPDVAPVALDQRLAAGGGRGAVGVAHWYHGDEAGDGVPTERRRASGQPAGHSPGPAVAGDHHSTCACNKGVSSFGPPTKEQLLSVYMADRLVRQH